MLIGISHFAIALYYYLHTKNYTKLNSIEEFENKEEIKLNSFHNQFLKKDSRYSIIRYVKISLVIILLINFYIAFCAIFTNKLLYEGYFHWIFNKSTSSMDVGAINFFPLAFSWPLLFLILGELFFSKGLRNFIALSNPEIMREIYNYENSDLKNVPLEVSKRFYREKKIGVGLALFLMFFTLFYHLAVARTLTWIVLGVQMLIITCLYFYLYFKEVKGDANLVPSFDNKFKEESKDFENVSYKMKTKRGFVGGKIVTASEKSYEMEFQVGSIFDIIKNHTIYLYKQPFSSNLLFYCYMIMLGNYLYCMYKLIVEKETTGFGVINLSILPELSRFSMAPIFGFMGLVVMFYASVVVISILGGLRASKSKSKEQL